MNRDEILAYIAASEDSEECEAIRNAAAARAKAIRTAEFKARVAEFWKRTQVWKEGQTLYCGAQGTFIGGPLQRGDKCVVYAIQPRKKLLWVTVGKRTLGLNDVEVYRYRLQPDPPAKPITESERGMANRLSEVFK